MAYKYLTPMEYDEILVLAKSGVSQAEIGRRYGKSGSTICKIVAGRQKPRTPGKYYRPTFEEQVKAWVAAHPGDGSVAIAAGVGCTVQTVRRWFRLRDLKRS